MSNFEGSVCGGAAVSNFPTRYEMVNALLAEAEQRQGLHDPIVYPSSDGFVGNPVRAARLRNYGDLIASLTVSRIEQGIV